MNNILCLNDISSIKPNQKCKVYFNLHKQCLSIQQNGIVVAHVEEISLTNVSFLVNKKGREKVVRTKSKFVHAFVSGYISTEEKEEFESIVKYNPYKADHFYYQDSLLPIYQADKAKLKLKTIIV